MKTIRIFWGIVNLLISALTLVLVDLLIIDGFIFLGVFFSAGFVATLVVGIKLLES